MSSNDIENNVIEMNTKKETIMDTEKVKFEDIKTPTTVEEFRANLKRYYVSLGQDAIYVKVGDDSFGIPYSKISSFDDIYKLTKTGFEFGGGSPSILPIALYGMNSLREFMDRTGQCFSCNGFWSDPNSDIKVLEINQVKRSIKLMKKVGWVTLDNQIYREFYAKSLGEFSGYDADGVWVERMGEKYMSSLCQ